MRWKKMGCGTGCIRAGQLAALCLALSFTGVSPAFAVTESEVLGELVNGSMTPALVEMGEKADGLKIAVTTLCEQKDDASLAKARKAWVESYLSWRKAAPFLVGPARKIRPMYNIGRWWMLNDKVLEAVVSDEKYKELRGNVDVHGFAALEYQLFSPKDGASAATDLRCIMLKRNSDEVADLLGRVVDEYRSNHIAEKMVAAGDGKPFLLPSDALEVTMGQAINVTDQMLRDSVGLPSGYFNSVAKPDILEAWHSKNSLAALKAALTGLRLSLVGEKGVTGLIASKDGLLNKRNPELAKTLVKNLDTVEAEIDDIGGANFDLHSAVTKKPKLLKPLYDSIHTLQQTIIEASLQLELDILMPGEVGEE